MYKKVLGYSPIKDKIDASSALQVGMQANIDERDMNRIFILTEYFKRRFYLDCNAEQANFKFFRPKNNKSEYEYIKINNITELLNYAINLFMPSYKSQINEEIVKEVYLKRYKRDKNLYVILQYIYRLAYKYFKKAIIDNIKKYNPRPDLYKVVPYEYLYKNEFNFYSFEQILYEFSEISHKSKPIPPVLNDFGILIHDLSSSISPHEHKTLLLLYRSIIDRYHLYFNDLLSISDIEPYIFDNKKDLNIPILFNLPDIPLEPILPPYIDINFDSTTSKCSIEIETASQINIDDATSLISLYLVSKLYKLKNDLRQAYSEAEIKYISRYIDCNKEKDKSDFIDRLIGLYLWDKCYLLSGTKKLSQNSHINNLISRLKNNTDIKLKSPRHYKRCLDATIESIEQGKYLPF